ncbi:endoribonuclease Dicer homolog 2 [Magnolia sinica]|uniref:endoribonuclease Dicer homolog 2 n=1 Tax=Magnolia sinica TaxID=86752 RepID=UPI0026588800|nr:endoribonuclease Dicer homolog 2 [Magnolia sinica]
MQSGAMEAAKTNMVENQDGRKHRKLLPDSESEPPETFARNYQLEALEKAVKQNTIVFLETGSGKTLIAIMLLRSYAYQLRKPSDFIAVFLVPTVVLVNQQAEVVEMHTDLKVGRFWGEMGVDFWDAKTWHEHLEKYEVFVMTPQILLDNLRHSVFKLDRIKVLIFDECHHARGRSPYACIMTEFYHRQLRSNSTLLPRILGMTASPINSKGSSLRAVYGAKIRELETLMNSKVFTVTNEAVLAKFVPFSTPKLKLYKHVDMPYALFVSLADDLKTLKTKYLRAVQRLQVNDNAKESAKEKIGKLFLTFMYCVTELGLWPALKAAETLSSSENDFFFWGQLKDGLGERTVRNFSQDAFMVFSKYIPYGPEWCVGDDLSSYLDAGFLTAKVDCLIQSLLEYRNVTDLRCIIFVERVIAASVLNSLLSQVSRLSCWKTSYMAGNRLGLQSQTRKDQTKIVNAFRDGSVNIIVATQILEEGLDVQSCKLVVRFDPSPTVCSFIQSRGRARMQGSDYLLLIRSGDSSTLSRVKNYLTSGDIMHEESIRQASIPCLPLETEMCNEDFYCVNTTGAIVTLSSSVALIYFYCSRLPSDQYFSPSPRFDINKEDKCCTLHLPKSCPIQTIVVHGQHDMLKQTACLEACKKLREIGALTDYLLPELDETKAKDGQETGGVSYEDEQVDYFPGELVGHWLSFSEKGLYYCYSLSFKRNFNYDVPFRDIVLVVKCDLGAELASTNFQMEIDRGSVTLNMEYVGVIHLNADQVLVARRFQTSILRILIDRNLSRLKDALEGVQHETVSRIAYLLLPSVFSNQNSVKIDWECVRSILFSSVLVRSAGTVGGNAVHHRCLPSDICRRIQTKDAVVYSCILRNALVFTPHNGHIYCITGILDDLDGNSILKLRGGEALTYKAYYESKHGITLRYERESLLQGKHLFTPQNWLRKVTLRKEKESSNVVELPPELCVIIMAPISISILYSFSFIPSIMHRIETMLLAIQLQNLQTNHYMQNVIVPANKVMEALTTKKCQEEFSLESLETLGDSFLKYAASQQLFRDHEHHHEGLLSAKKEKMISNAALCELGCKQKLQGFIRNECFDPKHWTVPGDFSGHFWEDEMFNPTSKNIYNKGTRHIKRKVVADVVEALIGAYLSVGGEMSALFFMEWLGMKVNFVDKIPEDRPLLVKPENYVNISHLELLLHYSFRDPSLLVEALTHGSYLVPHIPRCYQRLEFLGDSVLDYLITVHLYNKYPGLSPGLLTDLRSASVNNDCYAHAAVKAGLNKHILHASYELHRQITLFVDNFEQSFSGSSFGWEAGTALPKVLGDVIESIAGAILIDSGFNKDAVWKSIRPLLEPLVTLETLKYEPVRELEDLCARKSYEKQFVKTFQNGIASITVEVKADGVTYTETRTAANKKLAKKSAAKAVLGSLKASIPGI